jgi:predicted alpha/beta-fold hydrolase
MRGADGSGEDIYHAGLTSDVRAALRVPELAHYRRVLLLGYSMGGHVALKAAIDRVDPRITAVAAICAPLNLAHLADYMDTPERRIYRRCIRISYERAYAAVEARRRAPTPLVKVHAARSCRERDSLTIVPRFGFASVEDYYRRASVATHIHKLRTRALLVESQNDPIVPIQQLRSAIERAPQCLTVRWLDRGGHLNFPANLDLGQTAPRGLEPQVLRWLTKL